MKLSTTSKATGLLTLASCTTACMQAYIGYDFIESTIQSAIIYVRLPFPFPFPLPCSLSNTPQDNGGFICHLWNLPITREETSYPLDCLEIDGLPWAAHIIKPNMENFRPEQPAQRWAIRVWHGDFNEQYVLDNPNWDGKDNMLHMNGAVWSCDRGEQYLEEEQKNEELWGSVGKK